MKNTSLFITILFITILFILLIFSTFFLNIISKKTENFNLQLKKQLKNYNECTETLDEIKNQLNRNQIYTNQLKSAICYYNGVDVGVWWDFLSDECNQWWMGYNLNIREKDYCESSLWLNCDININIKKYEN